MHPGVLTHLVVGGLLAGKYWELIDWEQTVQLLYVRVHILVAENWFLTFTSMSALAWAINSTQQLRFEAWLVRACIYTVVM